VDLPATYICHYLSLSETKVKDARGLEIEIVMQNNLVAVKNMITLKDKVLEGRLSLLISAHSP
jgi:ABC-type dipeptide/oligopeptide/nickel transport system ATPase component